MHKYSFQELKQLAFSERGEFGLTVEYQDCSTQEKRAENAVDDFVTSLGFKPIGKAWRVIERSEAVSTVSRILFCDLAYQQPLMEHKTALSIAESFANLFSPYSAKFYTNGSLDERGLLTWNPITESTFDHGVVAIDDQKIGMVWVEDED